MAERAHLFAAVEARDPGRVLPQQLGGEVAERANHVRLDQIDLAREVAAAVLDLARQWIAVAGGAAVVHDAPRRDEVVRALDVDAEERDVPARMIGHVLYLRLVKEDGGAAGGQRRWIERDAICHLGIELVPHARRNEGRDHLAEALTRGYVEVKPSACRLGGKPESEKPVQKYPQVSWREAHARELGQRPAS